MPRKDNRLANIRDYNETRQLLRNRTKIADVWKLIDYKKQKYRNYIQFENKSEYDIGDACNSSSSDEGCASFKLLSIGTTSIYISEYSVFAVVGTGIRLPEEQIESFNGIDD